MFGPCQLGWPNCVFTEGIVTGSAPGKDPSGILDFWPGSSGRGSFSAGPPRSGIANALSLERNSENWHSARAMDRVMWSETDCSSTGQLLSVLSCIYLASPLLFKNSAVARVSCPSPRMRVCTATWRYLRQRMYSACTPYFMLV